MTYRQAQALAEKRLKHAGIENAGREGWFLLSHAASIDRHVYYLHGGEEMAEDVQRRFLSLLERRARHVPLAYLTGEQEFYGLTFAVTEDVLIPRQDTEVLVEEALRRIRPGDRVLDLCTGSGCIAVSIAKNEPRAAVSAGDISEAALRVAAANAERNRTSVSFFHSDLFAGIDPACRYNVIVSNPPYIKSKVIPTLMPEVRDYEPRQALDGSADGLFFYRGILDKCREYLTEDGRIFFEIGSDQAMAVTALLLQAGFSEIEIVKDLAGLDRVVIGSLCKKE